MSAENVDVAATTEATTPVADANEPVEPKSAESAPAVTNADEDTTKVLDPVQKRIDELTRKRHEAQRDAEYWREQALRAQPKPEPPKPEPEADQEDKELAEFGYDEAKYKAYLRKQADARAEKAAESVLQRKQTETYRTQQIIAHKAREAAFAKKAPDYFEVAHNAPIDNVTAALVIESEQSADLAYYLGKNPEVALRITQLPERTQARELGRLEAKLASTPVVPVVSQAPPPAPRLGGSDATSAKPDSADSDKLSDAEWVKRRNQQLAARKRH